MRAGRDLPWQLPPGSLSGEPRSGARRWFGTMKIVSEILGTGTRRNLRDRRAGPGSVRSRGRPLASAIAGVNKVVGIGAGRDLQTQRGHPRWIRDGESPGNANEAGTITTVNKVLGGGGTGKSYRRSYR